MDAMNPRNTKPCDPKGWPRYIQSRKRDAAKHPTYYSNVKSVNGYLETTARRGLSVPIDLSTTLAFTQPINEVDEDSKDDGKVCVVISMKRGSDSGKGTSKCIPKKPRHKGRMDMFFARKPEDVLTGRKRGRQHTINEVCKKELRFHACRLLAKWFYNVGLPFNAANYDSFQIAIKVVAQFGPGFKPPSMYELRVPLLKKEVEDTENV
ncbi:hypothetical protein Tco_1276016 [Tanacetum coccineum]